MIQEKWLLIGHRGAGKSSFLRGLRGHFETLIDLDDEIEKRSKTSITEFFSKFGEGSFRKLEGATLDVILKENHNKSSIVIAIGAGFDARIWPREYKCLWLRKESDVWPRYFLDRPAVGTSDPDNFLSSYIEREERYQKLADVAWTLEEGHEQLSPEKLEWPLDLKLDHGACLTLVPRLHKEPLQAIALRKSWNLRFELRSDHWPAETIKKVLETEKVPLVVSVRTKTFPLEDVVPKDRENIWVDWDISFGEVPPVDPDIVSLHDFSGGLKEGLSKLQRYLDTYPNVMLKAAPVIASTAQLEILWKWRELNPEKHLIFPRTIATAENAQWQWVRLLLKGKQALNFVREATEGPKDQPTLLQFKEHVVGDSFAAIIGDPVFHSYSPLFHREFFAKKNMPFIRIPVSSNDFTLLFFDFLDRLGAKAFAVTSPFKEHGVLIAKSEAADSEAETVFNTLVKKKTWLRHNTDVEAAEQLLTQDKVAWRIWGAGAVARQCFDLLDDVQLYSARTAERVANKGNVEAEGFNLLWAAGDEAAMPPATWKPLKILDLSYTQRSHAILYANALKVDYKNGLEFFKIQAIAQQELWSEI